MEAILVISITGLTVASIVSTCELLVTLFEFVEELPVTTTLFITLPAFKSDCVIV